MNTTRHNLRDPKTGRFIPAPLDFGMFFQPSGLSKKVEAKSQAAYRERQQAGYLAVDATRIENGQVIVASRVVVQHS